MSWLLFVVLCVGIGLAIGGKAAGTEDFRVGEAGRGEAMAARGGLQQRALERVLITARPGTEPDTAAVAAAVRAVSDRMRALPEVETVGAPQYSRDGGVVRIDVVMAGVELDGKKHVGPLRAQTAQVQAANPDLLVEETGGPSISRGVEELRGRDLSRTELIALPLTLLTLLVVFRSVTLALVPPLLAISAIAAAIGLSMPASHLVPDNGVGTNIILLIGMAVGVDYTLFYLKREREERARARGRLPAAAVVALAAATSGRAVMISGFAVAISSAAMFLADDVIFSSIATATILVTLVAVLGSSTVLPGLLVLLGARSDRPGQHSATDSRWHRPGRITGAMLGFVAREPAAALAVSVLALLGATAPLLGLELSDMGRETHPRSIAAMRTFDRLNQAFPELKSMHQVVVTARPEMFDQVTGALSELARRAQSDPALAGTSELRFSPDHRVALLELPVPHYVSEPAALASLERLRDMYVPATVGALPDAESAVTGDVARYADYPEHQKRQLPWVVGALLLATCALTIWAFRSVVLGLVGVVLNLLSAGAALGLLTVTFQHTWAERLLDFHSTGTIGSRVPLLLLVILFGLSMDYQVFVLSRIEEARRSGLPMRQAVLDGIGGSASVVTSAAFVMTTVFAAFVPLHIMEMKQMGFALAIAVLLDAFVIRILLLPALLLLLGDRTWWPARLPGRTRDVGDRAWRKVG
ncbi:MMPL family transporter [Nocardia yamanashiensis]|uniref:MMPL family transporter n=1 Tax=Nocardia yamanashiensis TaxID=209247 RepID=UPI000B100801|nr:MMPL family transporter [Nocardia yamanashiensis]